MKLRYLLPVVALAACTPAARKDAPSGPIDNTPARVVQMPDQFPNISFKCLGTTGLYVTTRANDSLIVVNYDKNCSTG